jgi:hypothetical protein
MRTKMNKKFLEINMPEWLYDMCIEYSKKHHVTTLLWAEKPLEAQYVQTLLYQLRMTKNLQASIENGASQNFMQGG